jgi:hypothetical protein
MLRDKLKIWQLSVVNSIGRFGAFEENAAAEIEKQFATSVFGVFHVTRAVLPVMRQARSGHIFNISAIGGLVGYPNLSLYSKRYCGRDDCALLHTESDRQGMVWLDLPLRCKLPLSTTAPRPTTSD